MRSCRAPWTLLSVLAAGLVLALPAMGAEDKSSSPPSDAKVLFDGKDLSGWVKRDGTTPAQWKVHDGYVEIVSGTGDIMTKEKFGPDYKLHVEFWLPLMKDQSGQGRANSGVYLQGRYEIQVLDCYNNKTYANGSVGALYGIIAPDEGRQKEAVRPPEKWNSYDITFHAPRVDKKGKVTKKGRLTVVLNGVTIIDDGTFDHVTGGNLDSKIGSPGPILLQDHHNKKGAANVRYRNIWLQPLTLESKAK